MLDGEEDEIAECRKESPNDGEGESEKGDEEDE